MDCKLHLCFFANHNGKLEQPWRKSLDLLAPSQLQSSNLTSFSSLSLPSYPFSPLLPCLYQSIRLGSCVALAAPSGSRFFSLLHRHSSLFLSSFSLSYPQLCPALICEACRWLQRLYHLTTPVLFPTGWFVDPQRTASISISIGF